MRKGKRFTPATIEKWFGSGRGTGTLSNYRPWHQVTRGDPGSRGRSHLALWSKTGRAHHYLSDIEHDVFAFASMLRAVSDIREQFPLSLDEHPVELATYMGQYEHDVSAGTMAIAEEMAIKHPYLTKEGKKTPWILTTDLLLTLEQTPPQFQLLAVSVKSDDDLKIGRKRQLLQIERAYWERQSIEWLLITPSLYDKRVSMTVRRALPWGRPKLSEDVVPSEYIQACVSQASYFDQRSLTACINQLSNSLHVPVEFAQRIFWQSVWEGRLTVDLSRSAWPDEPIRILDENSFYAQNPLAARRSICL